MSNFNHLNVYTTQSHCTYLYIADTVTAIIMIWAAHSDPYQQAAFFARSVGTSLTPQIFRPFLMSTHTITENSTEQLFNSSLGSLVTPGQLTRTNNTFHNMAFDVADSRFQYGYLIISICLLCGSIMNFIVFFWDGKTIWRATKKSSTLREDQVKIKGTPKIMALILKFVMGFLLASVEESFGGLLMAFLVKYLDWTEKSATDMNTVFFAACAISRLLGIPFAKFVRASKILGVQILLIFSGYLVLTLAVRAHWTIPWISAILIGLGFGSSYPSLLNWSNSYMLLRGKETSVFFISVALGRMTSPPLVAYLFEKYSPVWFMYMGLIYAIILIIVYVCKFIFILYLLSKTKPSAGSEKNETHVGLTEGKVSP